MRWMLASVMVGVLGCGAEGTSGIDTAEVGDTSAELGETLDPCANITCDTPPDDCHAATGTCQNGVCSYAARDGEACDDGDPCTSDDRCNDGCGGRQVACTVPPADACEDGTTLIVHAATGTCGADGCSYESQRVACASGCVDGACAGDACAGVVCNAPPSACHQAAGRCVSGVCRYDFDDGAACDDGDTCSTNDQCEAGMCVGMGRLPCTTPPSASCSGDTLSVPAANGACAAGQCSYASTTVTCQLGCAASGTACAGDPCEGVVCNTPPAATCISNVRHVFSGGTCNAGTCAYTETTQICTNGCSPGGCLAPAGVVISEVLYDAEGADDDVFVELHGTPGASLAGLTLVGRNGNGGNDYQSITLSGTFDSDGLFVIADPNAAPWIADMADQLAANVDYQNGPDSIQLRSGANVVDAVGYGAFTASDVFMGEGSAHPGIEVAGQSLVRAVDYRDTNDNAADFAVLAKPTPGAPNVVDTNAPTGWKSVAVGATFTYGVRADGSLWGWGRLHLEITGAVQEEHRPVRIGSLDGWEHVATYRDRVCGIMDGFLYCWGWFPVGDATGEYRRDPVRLRNDETWLAVAVGLRHTCAIDTSHRLFCWGDNGDGQLGISPIGAGQIVPRQVSLLLANRPNDDWQSLALGEEHTCGVTSDAVWCWGASGSGQYINVGFDVNPNYQETMPVTSLLAAGRHHTCTLDTATQRVRCYGYNSLGQGGSSPDGNGADTLVGWTQIDAARDSTCGVLAGKLYCFGALVGGPEAQQMGTRSNWRMVDLGYGDHQCAIDTADELYCWGNNDGGQLGDGTTTARDASGMVLVTP